MLHLESSEIRHLLFQGKFGLEKEGLRVLADGSLSRAQDPFSGISHVTRDFSENQTEINTSAEPSAQGAVHALKAYVQLVQKTLARLPEREYIWPFSNPPFLGGEEDIPIARFEGPAASKTAYREYLSGRYGRYKMTFSGIHVNYSFSEKLLQKELSMREPGRSRAFRDSFYLELAEKCAAYGWLLVILTAASPVLDASFYELGARGRDAVPPLPSQNSAGHAGFRRSDPGGRDVFSGMASVRCSELGYWNAFTPVFDYGDMESYYRSVRRYVDEGLLCSASELYYPVRLKPCGENSLENLLEKGADHLELRMFDINPFEETGLDVRDVQFTQLFLVWLASLPRMKLSVLSQVFAVQNFKSAARYDLGLARIVIPEAGGPAALPAREAALHVLDRMRGFFRTIAEDTPDWTEGILDFERKKILDPGTRYAARARDCFSGTYLEKGMAQAVRLQEECCRKSCSGG